MVLPARLGRLNRVALNRVTRPVAGLLPGFGIVVHRGRRSGETYRTPLNVFETDDGYVFALTYGREADWVKNVLAAGRCELITRRRRIELTEPRIVRDETRRDMPRVFVRRVLAFIDVGDFLYMTVER